MEEDNREEADDSLVNARPERILWMGCQLHTSIPTFFTSTHELMATSEPLTSEDTETLGDSPPDTFSPSVCKFVKSLSWKFTLISNRVRLKSIGFLVRALLQLFSLESPYPPAVDFLPRHTAHAGELATLIIRRYGVRVVA
jgi:hypothetical protein